MLNILVVGAGNCGITYSADLSNKGHNVTLLKSSSLKSLAFESLVRSQGLVIIRDDDRECRAKINRLCISYDDAFKGVDTYDVIIITVQTNYHENIIVSLKPYLNEKSIVLLEPGYGSSALFVKHKINCVVVEAQSSPIDCRVNEKAECEVIFRNIRNPIGIFSENDFDLNITKQKLHKLKYDFVFLNSVLEASLHNPNLIVHTVGAIMSIPRIEYSQGDYWMYKEVFTPSVWRIVESLDSEKNNVLMSLGLPKLDYVDACKFRNFEDISIDAKGAFFDYAQNHSPKGPFTSDSRYITEDVPQGLVFLESLGKLMDIETPTCTSLINIAIASLGVDFREKGRSVSQLGLTKEKLKLFVN